MSNLARLLSRSGYAAQCIESGEEALIYLQNCKPAVVFLDVMMPGIGGFELLKWIRQNEKCKDVIVLMYSALPDAEFQRLAAELGANDYIVKGSLTFDQIQALVDRHIDGSPNAMNAVDATHLRLTVRATAVEE